MTILIDMEWVEQVPEFAKLTRNLRDKTFQIEIDRRKISNKNEGIYLLRVKLGNELYPTGIDQPIMIMLVAIYKQVNQIFSQFALEPDDLKSASSLS